MVSVKAGMWSITQRGRCAGQGATRSCRSSGGLGLLGGG